MGQLDQDQNTSTKRIFPHIVSLSGSGVEVMINWGGCPIEMHCIPATRGGNYTREKQLQTFQMSPLSDISRVKIPGWKKKSPLTLSSTIGDRCVI